PPPTLFPYTTLFRSLDVLDPGLHLALALRVVALTGVDAVVSGGCILVEALIERQLTILLVDHYHLGLIVDALLGDAAEVTEGLIMHLDKPLGVQRAEVEPDVHQPGTGQHKHHKVNDTLQAANHDAPQLTGIDLTLDARHRLNHRFVVAQLTAGNLLLECLHIPADAPV